MPVAFNNTGQQCCRRLFLLLLLLFFVRNLAAEEEWKFKPGNLTFDQNANANDQGTGKTAVGIGLQLAECDGMLDDGNGILICYPSNLVKNGLTGGGTTGNVKVAKRFRVSVHQNASILCANATDDHSDDTNNADGNGSNEAGGGDSNTTVATELTTVTFHWILLSIQSNDDGDDASSGGQNVLLINSSISNEQIRINVEKGNGSIQFQLKWEISDEDKQQMAQGALLDEVLTAENRLFMDIVPPKGSDDQISIRWRHDGKTACKQQTTPTTTVSPGVQPTTHDYSKPLTPEQRKTILLNHRSIKFHQKILGFSDRDMEIMLECYDEQNEIIKQCNFPKAPPGIQVRPPMARNITTTASSNKDPYKLKPGGVDVDGFERYLQNGDMIMTPDEARSHLKWLRELCGLNETNTEEGRFRRQSLDDKTTLWHIFKPITVLLEYESRYYDELVEQIKAKAQYYKNSEEYIQKMMSNFEKIPLEKWHAMIVSALKHIEKHSCIRFTVSTVNLAKMLNIKYDIKFVTEYPGCRTRSKYASQFGETIEPHLVYIGWAKGCHTSGTVVHEMLHALGIMHEHQRTDRDSGDNIWVFFDEVIDPGQFEILKYTTTMDMPYDMGSIMHYTSRHAIKNDSSVVYTMVTRKREYQETIGQRLEMSFRDIKMLNMRYECGQVNCPDQASADGIGQCKNSGIVDPNNCNQCICPTGFDGQYCDQIPKGKSGMECGGVQLQATNSSTRLSQTANTTMECVWHIVPKYTQYEIELYISMLNFQSCVPHAEYYSSYICSHSYVEIKYLEEDKAATGARLCCADQLPYTIMAPIGVGEVIVILHTDEEYPQGGFELDYRLASDELKDDCGCNPVCYLFYKDRNPNTECLDMDMDDNDCTTLPNGMELLYAYMVCKADRTMIIYFNGVEVAKTDNVSDPPIHPRRPIRCLTDGSTSDWYYDELNADLEEEGEHKWTKINEMSCLSEDEITDPGDSIRLLVAKYPQNTP